MAAALLGTYHPQRKGFCAACGLHSLQSREARPDNSRTRLAVLVLPPLRPAGRAAGGLGGCRSRTRDEFRRADRSVVARMEPMRNPSPPRWRVPRISLRFIRATAPAAVRAAAASG